MTSVATAFSVTQGRRGRWLAWAFAAAGLGVSLARGLTGADGWAGAQLAFTCDIAPKRCGFGQVLSVLHVPIRTLGELHALGLVMLAAVLIALFAAARASRLADSSEGVMAVGAVAASYGFSVFVSYLGYLDVVMAAIVALCLVVPDRWRAPVTLAGALAGVLVHEGFLVMFLPVALLPLILSSPKPRGLLWPLATAALALLIVFALAFHKPLSEAGAMAAWRTLQGRVDYPVSYDSIHVLTRSLGDNLRLMLAISQTHVWQITALGSLAVLLPVAVLFGDLVLHGFPAQPWAKALAAACALSPLAMNALGYDIMRWVGLCSLTMLFALAALARRYGAPRLSSPVLFAVVAIALSLTPLAFPRLAHSSGGAHPEVDRLIQAI